MWCDSEEGEKLLAELSVELRNLPEECIEAQAWLEGNRAELSSILRQIVAQSH
jgi:signal transduction histidine kinase